MEDTATQEIENEEAEQEKTEEENLEEKLEDVDSLSEAIEIRSENDTELDELAAEREVEIPQETKDRILENRQISKMLEEHPPSHWIKGPDKLEGESHGDWKERQRLEQKLIDLYM